MYYLSEFLLYYFILALGDFSLYHMSNFIHDVTIKKDTREIIIYLRKIK